MSNLDTRPDEMASQITGSPVSPPGAVEVLQPRLVPLGGPRAMTVRRTLPQRQRSMIGGWCFIDHYGPDPVAQTGGMFVPPHPHTCLQTVSWLFTGEVEHRDSAGNHVLVRPGELNLMTAGRGIAHSEVSVPGLNVLHGVQLWVALPAPARFTEPGFEYYAPDLVRGDEFTVRVFLGSLLGSSSPVTSYSPLLGAEISIAAGRLLRIPADPGFEYGVLADAGPVTLNGAVVETAQLGCVTAGAELIELAAGGDGDARVLLLGGTPLGEQIVMWWNFIGRSHDEIVRYRANWQALIGAAPPGTAGAAVPGSRAGAGAATGEPGQDPGQFGLPVGDTLRPMPAPPMPNAKLRARV